MIITVTLNPALDKTAELDNLRPGELNRLRNVVTDAGGKGVNVSKMIAALGGASVATGFAGGGSGEEIVKTLRQMGIRNDFVEVGSTARTNLKILDQGGARLTELNEPGVTVTGQETKSLLEKLEGYAKPDSIFVLSGSLCQGVEAEFYARLIRMIHNNGGAAYLDADGEAFRAALEEKPDFIKPNRRELMEYFRVDGEPDLPELKELCMRLAGKGVPKIALSMGKDGAIFVREKDALYAPGLPVKAHSAVGAGDSMMGAIAYAANAKMPWKQAAALALAASAGAVATIGTKPPDKQMVEHLLGQVRFTVI